MKLIVFRLEWVNGSAENNLDLLNTCYFDFINKVLTEEVRINNFISWSRGLHNIDEVWVAINSVLFQVTVTDNSDKWPLCHLIT